MNHKKVLIFILFLIIFGIDTVYAEDCYYQSSEISLQYSTETGKFQIDQRGTTTKITAKNEPLLNNGSDKKDGYRFLSYNGTGITAKAIPRGTCPTYIVYRRFDGVWFFNGDGVWGFNDYSAALEFENASNQINPSRLAATSAGQTTATNYQNRLETLTNSNAKYKINGIETSDEVMDCDELFDDSIMQLIKDVLQYPRIIVPGIVLVLGMVDLGRAVAANSEDEMKKAQKTFIKRVIISVCVFLVPVFIDIIMWLANIAWKGLGYATCNFK